MGAGCHTILRCDDRNCYMFHELAASVVYSLKHFILNFTFVSITNMFVSTACIKILLITVSVTAETSRPITVEFLLRL
jgi:hypothetical protein